MLKKRKKQQEYEYEDYDEDYDDDENEFDLVEILIMIKRHWKIIVTITGIFTILGSGFAFTRKPEYSSTTTLIVSSGNYYSAKNLDQSELSMNQKLATLYTAVAKSDSVLSSVIKKLDLEVSNEELSKVIDIQLVKDTELIRIAAKDGNSIMASRIANETATEFMNKVKDVMSFENVKVVESAEVSDKPLPQKRLLIIAVAFLAGIASSSLLAIAVELFHSKLRRPKDIEKIMGVSILTNVPKYDEVDEIDKKYKKGMLESFSKFGKDKKK